MASEQKKANGGAADGFQGLSADAVKGLEVIGRAAASVPMQRAGFAQRTGLSFETSATKTAGFKRDLDHALGRRDKLEPKDYRALYERGGIAERIVEAAPSATWSSGAIVQEDPGDNTTPFEAAVEELFARLKVWPRLLAADILAGLGHYAVVMIGEAVEDHAAELRRPTSAQRVACLKARGEDKATIARRVKVKGDPRFGLPEVYQLDLGEGAKETEVHHTRIVHVADGGLEDDLFGKPRLRAVYNYLDDLTKIEGGGSEAFWKRVDPGMLIKLDPEGRYKQAVLDEMTEQVDELIHGMRRMVRTRGIELEQLEAQVSNFNPQAMLLLKLIAGVAKIPLRILIGSERGELASSQDDRNWAERIAKRQATFATPVVRDLVDRFVFYGILPRVESYEVVWPESEDLDEATKADIAARFAEANKRQVEAGDTIITTSAEIRTRLLGLESLGEADPQQAGLRAGADTADDEPDSEEWQAVHRAADANRSAVTRTIADAWARAGRAVDLEALVDELAAGDADAAVALVEAELDEHEDHAREILEEQLLATFVSAARRAARAVRARGSWFRGAGEWAERPIRGAALEVDFDATNPRALKWAEDRAASLVVEIGPDTRAAIREIVVAGFDAGVPVRTLARQVRQAVGLHSRWARAVTNFQDRILAAQPGDVVEAYTGRIRVRIPAAGPSMALAQEKGREYAGRLLTSRAITIARTETMRAANEGLRELWRQGLETGSIAEGAQRVWISTPDDRTRPEHEDRDGETVGVDEEWPWGTEPGQEPRCRCSQGLSR